MKNKLFIAAASLMLAACSQQEIESEVPEGGLTGSFEKAIVEDEAQTKAAFDSEYSFIWKTSDEISVLLTNGNTTNFILSTGAGTKSGSFTGSLTAGQELSDKLAYPESCALTASGVSFNLPSSYAYGEPMAMYGGSDASLTLPCWAQIVGGNFTMKYLTGFFLFEISKIPAGTNKFEFTVTNGKRVNGAFAASFGSGEPQFAAQDASDDAEKTITITFSPSAKETTRAFIIPVPAGDYTYKWQLSDDTKLTGFGERKTAIIVDRGRIKAIRVACSSIGSEKYVTFADAKFEAYCVKNFDKNGDGKVSLEEAKAVTSINVSGTDSENNEITSLQGIEYFVNVTMLSCMHNQLTELNVSKNTALTELYCGGNQLTSLDVSKNTALTKLGCHGNQLTKLDVSKNTALAQLDCMHNQLTELNVSQNTALTSLYCLGNQLTSLDVSQNTALTVLRCEANQLTSIDVSKNTALTELWVGVNQLNSLDVSNNTALTRLHCSGCQLTELNVSKNTALMSLDCGSNLLTELDLSKNTALTALGCQANQLTELNVSNCTKLVSLYCQLNQLENLDVSNNTNLSLFNCGYNLFTSLDVSKNTNLQYLGCQDNQLLTQLDVSQNTKLRQLDCYNCPLTSLDVSQNTALTTLNCDCSTMTKLYLATGQTIATLNKNENTAIAYK